MRTLRAQFLGPFILPFHCGMVSSAPLTDRVNGRLFLHLVGRENIPTADALSMLVVRIGSVISPAVAGVVMWSFWGVTWNYTLAAMLRTLCHP